MLLELSIGDSYGCGFEFTPKDFVLQNNDLTQYHAHPKHGLDLGQYTDDTQMSLAITEALLLTVQNSQNKWSPLLLANKFVEVFKRDERPGYAKRFQKFLESVNSGEEFLEKIVPASDRNGAAMRAIPLGIIKDINKLMEYSNIQSAITHNTECGINAGLASALLSHYFIWDLGDKKDVGNFLNLYAPSDDCNWDDDYVGKVQIQGWRAVQAAVTAIKRNDTLGDLLWDCINFTGDVDTVGAIALGAASNSREYIKIIPKILFDTLENGTYGRNYIIKLDQKLLSLKGQI